MTHPLRARGSVLAVAPVRIEEVLHGDVTSIAAHAAEYGIEIPRPSPSVVGHELDRLRISWPLSYAPVERNGKTGSVTHGLLTPL